MGVYRRSMAVIACLVTGCTTEPTLPALIGQFGGKGLHVVATDTAARFEFACGLGVTGPLRLASSGSVQASGTYVSRSAGFRTEPLAIAGTLTGDALSLRITIGVGRSRGTGEAYVQRDSVADFSGVACLAATSSLFHK